MNKDEIATAVVCAMIQRGYFDSDENRLQTIVDTRQKLLGLLKKPQTSSSTLDLINNSVRRID